MLYIFIVSLICFGISGYIELNKHFAIDSCFKAVSGCAIVDRSSFSDFAGLPVSILGILSFLILSILSFLQFKKPNQKRKKLITGLITLISLFAIYLIIAQVFFINAFCKYCLIVDFLILSMLAALFFP